MLDAKAFTAYAAAVMAAAEYDGDGNATNVQMDYGIVMWSINTLSRLGME